MKQIWFTLMALLCTFALAAAKPDLSTTRPLATLGASGSRHVYDSPASPRLFLRLVQPYARDQWMRGLHDLLFCRALLGPSASADARRFTGKERDAETGLDYFGARYMSSAQGRFTSPDPLLSSAHITAPQSWNRYAYTLNNPLRFTDPHGLYVCNGTNAECKDFESALKQVERARNSFKKGWSCPRI